jgi:hypothetical protein
MAKEWDRLKGETGKAFTAFQRYLAHGAKRSTDTVAHELSKSSEMICRWCRKYDWVNRAAAYDGHYEIIRREAVEAVTKSMAMDWVKRQEQHRQDEWEYRNKLVELARVAIERWMNDARRTGSLEGIARILEMASKLGRLSTGMPTDHTEVTGQVNHSLDPEWELAMKKVYGEVLDVKAEVKEVENG